MPPEPRLKTTLRARPHRTLEKLEKYWKDLDNSYEKLAELQAEGAVNGFNEENHGWDTENLFVRFCSLRMAKKVEAVFDNLTKTLLNGK